MLRKSDLDNMNLTGWCDFQIKNKLSENFMRMFYHKLNWKLVSEHQALSDKFMEENANNLDFYYACKSQVLTDSFILKNIAKLHFENTVKYRSVSNDMLAKIFKIHWSQENLCFAIMHQHLSDDFLKKVIPPALGSIGSLGCTSDLPAVTDLTKFWKYLCYYQEPSEQFLEEFNSSLCWEYIFMSHHNLTNEFVNKHKDKLGFGVTYQYNPQSYVCKMCLELKTTNKTVCHGRSLCLDCIIKSRDDAIGLTSRTIDVTDVINDFQPVIKPQPIYQNNNTYNTYTSSAPIQQNQQYRPPVQQQPQQSSNFLSNLIFGAPVQSTNKSGKLLAQPSNPKASGIAPATSFPSNDQFQCKICFTNNVDTRYKKCGHTICSVCANQVAKKRICPFCNDNKVTELEKIFFS